MPPKLVISCELKSEIIVEELFVTVSITFKNTNFEICMTPDQTNLELLTQFLENKTIELKDTLAEFWKFEQKEIFVTIDHNTESFVIDTHEIKKIIEQTRSENGKIMKFNMNRDIFNTVVNDIDDFYLFLDSSKFKIKNIYIINTIISNSLTDHNYFSKINRFIAAIMF